ncbi:hypothetical protein R84B8_02324 [Treponema sp. R8-4-B8]
MEIKDDLNLLREIPTVLRARGFRLYLSNGKRLVDLWLNGGAAVLGHTPPNILRELKNTASRGLYAPFPHFTESRYLKSLSKIFPGRVLRLYAAPPQKLSLLFNNGDAKLWRPFSNPTSPFAVTDNAPILIPVLPGIQLWRGGLPLGLCITAIESGNQLANLPQSDILPPVLLATATRGIYDLFAAPNRATPQLQRVEKVLKKSRWQQRGIYLELREKAETENWTTLFQKFMEAGFLLPPAQSFPLILPGELSDGEEAKLAAVLGEG